MYIGPIYRPYTYIYIWGLPFSTYAPRVGGWDQASYTFPLFHYISIIPLHLHYSIAYYMQKGGEWVQIAGKIAYVLNGRPLYVMEVLSRMRGWMHSSYRAFLG